MPMAVNMLDSGTTTRRRERVCSHISMEANMREVSSMTRKRDRVRIRILTAMSTLGNGKMVDNMVLEFNITLIRMALKSKFSMTKAG